MRRHPFAMSRSTSRDCPRCHRENVSDSSDRFYVTPAGHLNLARRMVDRVVFEPRGSIRVTCGIEVGNGCSKGLFSLSHLIVWRSSRAQEEPGDRYF